MSRLLRVTTVCLILFSLLSVYISMPKEKMFARDADEGYYFMYAKTVRQNGIGQLPVLLERHFSDEVAQLYPHPARIGQVLITALWFTVFPNNFRSLAWLSFICFILFLMVSFYFSRRFFGSDIAYFYALLLSCSPLIMTSARRVLQDSILNLLWALCVWLFLDFLVYKKKAKLILFIVFFSIAIASKESSLVLFIFFGLSYLVYKYLYRHEINTRHIVGMMTLPLLIVGMAYLSIYGLNNLLHLAKFIFSVHFPNSITNQYTLFAMGPWYKYIIDYLMLTPVTTLLCVGYIAFIAVYRKLEWKVAYFMIYLLSIYAIFSSAKYTKIVRFVMSLDIAVCLFSVLLLWEIFKPLAQKQRVFAVFAVIAGIFFINYQNFMYLFYTVNIYDPISYWLLMAQHIIPAVR